MQKAIFVNLTGLLLFLLVLATVASAQTVETNYPLESNILGIQQRNPAINPEAESFSKTNLPVNILVVLFLVAGGVWFYKKRVMD